MNNRMRTKVILENTNEVFEIDKDQHDSINEVMEKIYVAYTEKYPQQKHHKNFDGFKKNVTFSVENKSDIFQENNKAKYFYEFNKKNFHNKAVSKKTVIVINDKFFKKPLFIAKCNLFPESPPLVSINTHCKDFKLLNPKNKKNI